MIDNKLNISDFEVMAPAGSWESLTAAIQGGADAVYFGIEKLNMKWTPHITITPASTLVAH